MSLFHSCVLVVRLWRCSCLAHTINGKEPLLMVLVAPVVFPTLTIQNVKVFTRLFLFHCFSASSLFIIVICLSCCSDKLQRYFCMTCISPVWYSLYCDVISYYYIKCKCCSLASVKKQKSLSSSSKTLLPGL